MVLNGQEGLEFEVHVDEIRLLDESGIDGAECSRKVVRGLQVASGS